MGFLAVNMELSGTTRQVPNLLSNYFISFVNFKKIDCTLSGFIACVKRAPFGLLCAWREVPILRQHSLLGGLFGVCCWVQEVRPPLGPLVEFWFSPRFSGSLHGPDQRSLLVKPWYVLVLGRGVSEDFLVAWWRRSNHPPYLF
jgi:hypothetical protein